MNTLNKSARTNSALSIWLWQALSKAAALCCFMIASTSQGQRSPATLPNVRLSTSGLVLAIAVQDDGKVIIGGYFSTVNGVPRSNIARLNANGSVDEAWNPGASDAVRQIVISGTDV